jgi:DNA uptake protein ComE-like DNA-binding protein
MEAQGRIQALEGELAVARDLAAALRADLEAARAEVLELQAQLDAPPAPASMPAPAAAPAAQRPLVPVWADSRPINLSTASVDELMLLPGIGRRPAERIVAFRDANGGIASIDDLYGIDGIPAERITRIRPYVCV